MLRGQLRVGGAHHGSRHDPVGDAVVLQVALDVLGLLTAGGIRAAADLLLVLAQEADAGDEVHEPLVIAAHAHLRAGEVQVLGEGVHDQQASQQPLGRMVFGDDAGHRACPLEVAGEGVLAALRLVDPRGLLARLIGVQEEAARGVLGVNVGRGWSS